MFRPLGLAAGCVCITLTAHAFAQASPEALTAAPPLRPEAGAPAPSGAGRIGAELGWASGGYWAGTAAGALLGLGVAGIVWAARPNEVGGETAWLATIPAGMGLGAIVGAPGLLTLGRGGGGTAFGASLAGSVLVTGAGMAPGIALIFAGTDRANMHPERGGDALMIPGGVLVGTFAMFGPIAGSVLGYELARPSAVQAGSSASSVRVWPTAAVDRSGRPSFALAGEF